MITKEINLQTLTDEVFAGLCHALLLREYGTIYRPVAGDGGDSGIDGFIEGYSEVYQFKYFRARPRPSTFLKDIDKIANIPGLKRWVLVIPEDPTNKLYRLIAEEKAHHPFDVDVLGKTGILSLMDRYEDIRERFFPQIAKEASVQKGISQLKEIQKQLTKKGTKQPPPERPPDSLTPVHIRDIVDEVKRIEKVSFKKHPSKKIFAQLKNRYGVDNWHWIKDEEYGGIMAWLNRYYHGVAEISMPPSQVRRHLQGVIKSQQKMLALNDKEYRHLLSEATGKSSTTQMDIRELESIKHRFNILLATKT